MAWLNGVVRYMTPSTTRGVVSKDPMGPPVWYTQRGTSVPTFRALIRFELAYRVLL